MILAQLALSYYNYMAFAEGTNIKKRKADEKANFDQNQTMKKFFLSKF